MNAVAKEAKDGRGSLGLELQVVINHLVGAEKRAPALVTAVHLLTTECHYNIPVPSCSVDSQICPLLMLCVHCQNIFCVANRLSHCGNLYTVEVFPSHGFEG